MSKCTSYIKGIESSTTLIESEMPTSIQTSKGMSKGVQMGEKDVGWPMTGNETKRMDLISLFIYQVRPLKDA